MGGAGTALPEDSVAALMLNPALIGAEPGNQISFTTEFFQNSVKIDVNAYSKSGHAEGLKSLGIIPAFGWQAWNPTKKYAIGFGLIGIAGFKTDWPQDDPSILFATAPNGGFGRVYTYYGVLNIPVAFSFRATPKLTLGASPVFYRINLDISPLPS